MHDARRKMQDARRKMQDARQCQKSKHQSASNDHAMVRPPAHQSDKEETRRAAPPPKISRPHVPPPLTPSPPPPPLPPKARRRRSRLFARDKDALHTCASSVSARVRQRGSGAAPERKRGGRRSPERRRGLDVAVAGWRCGRGRVGAVRAVPARRCGRRRLAAARCEAEASSRRLRGVAGSSPRRCPCCGDTGFLPNRVKVRQQNRQRQAKTATASSRTWRARLSHPAGLRRGDRVAPLDATGDGAVLHSPKQTVEVHGAGGTQGAGRLHGALEGAGEDAWGARTASGGGGCCCGGCAARRATASDVAGGGPTALARAPGEHHSRPSSSSYSSSAARRGLTAAAAGRSGRSAATGEAFTPASPIRQHFLRCPAGIAWPYNAPPGTCQGTGIRKGTGMVVMAAEAKKAEAGVATVAGEKVEADVRATVGVDRVPGEGMFVKAGAGTVMGRDAKGEGGQCAAMAMTEWAVGVRSSGDGSGDAGGGGGCEDHRRRGRAWEPACTRSTTEEEDDEKLDISV
ncbi:Protein of unknown function [Gryllus bimaculatus]|nr:Protein of unknown function [Gryllus bimaculatus]